MQPQCEIQWLNDLGHKTPDNNPSIGRVRTKERDELCNGQVVHFNASRYFHICAEHAKRLTEPGMHIWEWEPRDRRHIFEFTARELATILAALRVYQDTMSEHEGDHPAAAISSDLGRFEPLTDSEIDTLCQELNS